MKHSELIKLGQALGYKSIHDRGLCKGFSMMWIEAVCVGESEVANLNKRMRLLEHYASTPQKLAQDIAKVRNIVKEGKKELTYTQKMILEVPSFFEGISLYLQPDMHKEIWGNKRFNQQNEVDIANYIQSQMMEEMGGLSKPFKSTEQYDQKGLVNFLNKLSDRLQDRKDVGVDLAANNHSVAIRVLGKNKFQLVDTNHLDKAQKTYTSEELAKQLNQSFFNENSWFNWFNEPKPLLINTSIFTSQDRPIQDIKLLHSNVPITHLADTKPFNLLSAAACNNDVSTIKRIDFNIIDVNLTDDMGITALHSSCYSNSEEAFNFLLTIPSVNVNHGKISLFDACLYTKQFNLAKKLLDHPSFDPNIAFGAGNALHRITYMDSSPETIEIAKEIIKKGVDVNAPDDFGRYPIYNTCLNGNLPLFEVLLEQGANPFIDTPQNDTLLFASAINGHNNLMDVLLGKGLDPNQVNRYQENPLHYACLNGHLKIVETLLSRDVDCNRRSVYGLTPLMMACDNSHIHLIPILLPKTNLSMKDIQPDSPLVKQITMCDQTTQIEFLKKALTCYIKDRSADKQYLNWFNWGFSRDEKIQAAQALLDRLDGKETDCQPHIDVLNNSRLSNLYNLSIPHLNITKRTSHGADSAGSFGKMCTLMGVTSLPAEQTNTNTSSPVEIKMKTTDAVDPTNENKSALSSVDSLSIHSEPSPEQEMIVPGF